MNDMAMDEADRTTWGPSMADDRREAGLSPGQRAAVAVSVMLGLGLAAYGVAGSYKTVSALAIKRGVPLAPLVPVGIDGGLIGVVVLDLVLSWIGQSIGWLRQLVRVLTAGTVAANAAAGWPDTVSAGLHAAAPLMLLAMVEAGRTVLLRRIRGPDGGHRDPIPVARWLLAPWSTWLMWRRMVLWQSRGYRAALEAEQERRHAVALLRARYGKKWRDHAPPDLAWTLRSGAPVLDIVAKARALAEMKETASERTAVSGDGEALGSDMSGDIPIAANGQGAAIGHGAAHQVGPSPVPAPQRPPKSLSAVGDRGFASDRPERHGPLVQAAMLLTDRPDMSGADLGRELGVSERHGLRLKKQIRSGQDQTA